MKPFRVYLAASFATKRDAIIRASELRSLGIDVTSQWLDSVHNSDDELDDEAQAAAALGCHRDIERSDALLLLVGNRTSAGKYIEFGIALASGKRIILVETDGPAPTVFRNHPYVTERFGAWEPAVEWLREQLR